MSSDKGSEGKILEREENKQHKKEGKFKDIREIG